MATNDPREKTQRQREDRFDRFLDVAEDILRGDDGGDELGDEPEYDSADGTEPFAAGGGGDDGDDGDNCDHGDGYEDDE